MQVDAKLRVIPSSPLSQTERCRSLLSVLSKQKYVSGTYFFLFFKLIFTEV